MTTDTIRGHRAEDSHIDVSRSYREDGLPDAVSDAGAPGVAPAPSLAIVVPVFNEEATIDAGVREIAAVADRYPGRAIRDRG